MASSFSFHVYNFIGRFSSVKLGDIFSRRRDLISSYSNSGFESIRNLGIFLDGCKSFKQVTLSSFFFTRNEKLTETITDDRWKDDTILLKRGYVSPRSDKAAFCKQYLSSKLFRRNCNCELDSYGNSVCKLYPRLKFLDTRYPRLSQNLPPAMETKSN